MEIFFLTNDTNLSVDQYVGNVTLSNDIISDWCVYFSELNKLQVEHKLFLLVPSKEELFKEFYPFERAKHNTSDLFLEKFSLNSALLYPFQELCKYKDFSYLKADTHWSDYGAYICVRVILERLGLSDYSDLLSNDFNVSEFAGDLGNKLPTRQTAIGLKSYKSIAPSFDNLIHNHGRIWIFESAAPIKETLIIFGDSFSASKNANYLANQLSIIFNRVIFIHSAGAIDKSILAYEKPKYLICQINQRFIIQSPKMVDIWQVVNKKFRTLGSQSREDLKSLIYKSCPNLSNNYYVEKMLEIIKNADAEFMNQIISSVYKRILCTHSTLNLNMPSANNLNHLISNGTNLIVKTDLTGGVFFMKNLKALRKVNIVSSGKNTLIVIGRNVTLDNCQIDAIGDNCFVYIGDGCRLKSLTILARSDSVVCIGKHTTWESGNLYNQLGKMVILGEDCMISNEVTVRAGEDHGIFDSVTKERISYPSDILIENHVWIGNSARINKGVIVGTGAIIGQCSVVSKDVERNCIYGGTPAKKIRDGVVWSRTGSYDKIPEDYRNL